jgi:uncharacterized pyridoxal phosphate-dependent enzyme
MKLAKRSNKAMSNPIRSILSRRQVLWTSAALGWLPTLRAATNSTVNASGNIYEKIGVRPVINCRGTYTVIGGSLELPEVSAAQQAAAQHFVQLDELADGVGQRLAELTGAPWGMVPSGCAAGLAHATAACIAGGNPDLHTRIPDLRGFAKDEVVIPTHSRNEYDAAVRSIGVRITEVADAKQYEEALGPRVAMVYVLAGPEAETGRLTYDTLYSLAKARNIPVLVDAAAEILTIPNVHLQRGATLVGYSGGKCIRGPQSSGLLLGRKDLVKAAWVHSAPHHGYGRTMKVGKEEAMGMLAAVEAWSRRDHAAEWKEWISWMNHIASVVGPVDGVSCSIEETKELSNQTPELNIKWDTSKIGISGMDVERALFAGEPRITLFGRNGGSEAGVSITAYMMQPGDAAVVAQKLHEALSKASGSVLARDTTPPASQIAGEWDVTIQFAASVSQHGFYLTQDNSELTGSHRGDFLTRDVSGSLHGNTLKLVSRIGEEHGAAITYTFTGSVKDGSLGGDLSLGEYRSATWTATPHKTRT